MDIEHKNTAADVVVMGAGLAGLAAGLSALENGAGVMLIEKGRKPGGSTVRAAGTFAFAGTDMQRAAGIEDTPALLADELEVVAAGAGDPALRARYVSDQLDTYHWLLERGVVLERVQLSGGQAVPRAHAVATDRMIETLTRCFLSRGGLLSTATAVERLQPARDGAWNAILSDGRFIVAKGVVIASGGFSRSPTLLRTFAPKLLAAVPISGLENTGDGLRIGMSLGAGLADMAWIKGTFGLPVPDYPALPDDSPEGMALLLAIYRGAIVVNREGRRFTDESASYKRISEACLAQPGAVAFQIFDDTVMGTSVPVPVNNDFRGALQRGLVRRADTVEELARSVGLTETALKETINTYNAMAGSGEEDAFGRLSLGGGVGRLIPLERPPFYAIPTAVGVTGTFCGLTVDSSMQVLDVFGSPIKGIFAAGEVVGGFHGENYMSGTGLGKAAIFGRVAGHEAVLAGKRLEAEAIE
ncbi:fumarate reductase/succinate dehydrogenase flavoprotein-like protein (plasmid) [Rhizobium gallicum]|uniref:Fumarate reductase/succinate dehydrogenase flavoprotein-like protein n=2 Tax=Rhizobium gallicum TaxID=56730 RepID=A0A1L5NS46_9HYPH|nr:fumarate reductase/succinate dehydrogenase flavoprotein-like protein [Rhizobium gallicum]